MPDTTEPPPMTKTDQFWKQSWRNAKREVLDADMRPSDLVNVLRRLKFDEPYCLIGSIVRCAIIWSRH